MKKLLLILAFILVLPALSYADTGDNVSGFAWSYNTGLIKLNNCVNNICDPVAYGVNIDSNTGAFEGYGWSPNVGWVDFTGGNCGTGAHATFAGNGSATISGWIKVISASQAGNNSGGWNGCIKMAGQAVNGASYGVTISSGTSPQQFSGQGWNANSATVPAQFDQMVGESWVDFTGARYVKELSSIDLSIDHWNTTCTPTNNKINLTWQTTGITPGTCQWTSELTGPAANNGNNQLFNLGTQQANYNITLSCGSPSGTITDTVSVSCDLQQCNDGIDNDGDGNTDSADVGCHEACPSPHSISNVFHPEFINESISYSLPWTVANCTGCTANTTFNQNPSCYCSNHQDIALCCGGTTPSPKPGYCPGTPPPPGGPLTAPKYEEL